MKWYCFTIDLVKRGDRNMLLICGSDARNLISWMCGFQIGCVCCVIFLKLLKIKHVDSQHYFEYALSVARLFAYSSCMFGAKSEKRRLMFVTAGVIFLLALVGLAVNIFSIHGAYTMTDDEVSQITATDEEEPIPPYGSKQEIESYRNHQLAINLVEAICSVIFHIFFFPTVLKYATFCQDSSDLSTLQMPLPWPTIKDTKKTGYTMTRSFHTRRINTFPSFAAGGEM